MQSLKAKFRSLGRLRVVKLGLGARHDPQQCFVPFDVSGLAKNPDIYLVSYLRWGAK